MDVVNHVTCVGQFLPNAMKKNLQKLTINWKRVVYLGFKPKSTAGLEQTDPTSYLWYPLTILILLEITSVTRLDDFWKLLTTNLLINVAKIVLDSF